MKTTTEIDSTTMLLHSGDDPTGWKQHVFYGMTIAFNLCLVAQVMTVGVAYFNNPVWWNVHVWLVRGYSGLPLLLWAGTWFVPLPSKIRSLSMGLVVLLGLQFCSIHLRTPFHLEVLHPLVGFSLFYLSSSLVHSVARSKSS
ncbi:hypothetical protein S7335_4224 [Synechococcus sp. PCC 7335]|uniref:DUF6220 domain-containing protein n=1 Tax=Synechococcus sp. (strain ATCC 29403 / PCC 7335) TaxID=91464 RepID=UPI00017ED293|nr:DUF6220 domain-containing protein [Synechococcus sp. PCC 7335]EDX86519.1 hypothetical protein S7335_4224 [Synechococcus sp. PCC 7335]